MKKYKINDFLTLVTQQYDSIQSSGCKNVFSNTQ